MVASCDTPQTCDSHKKSAALFLSPFTQHGPRPSLHLRYGTSGKVEPAPSLSTHVSAQVQQDIAALNLNEHYLVQNRKTVIEALKTAMMRKGFKKGTLLRLSRGLPTSGNPYAFVQLAQVHRWLKKLG